MTPRFENALRDVLHIEGGYNDLAADRGGATNYGISLRFLQRVRPGATKADVRRLRFEDAAALYHEHFWRRFDCAALPAGIGEAMFSIGVNLPPDEAVMVLQRALGRALPARIRVDVDGLLGPQTIEAAQVADPVELRRRLVAELCRYYRDLCASNPSQLVFLDGWFYRAACLFIPEPHADAC